MKCYLTRWLVAFFLCGVLLTCAYSTSEAKPSKCSDRSFNDDGHPDELPTQAASERWTIQPDNPDYNGCEGPALLVSTPESGESGDPFLLDCHQGYCSLFEETVSKRGPGPGSAG